MKIILVTYGSRGDVQPMLALSLELKSRGHDVLLAGPPEKTKWAEKLGCPFQPIGQDVTAFINSMQNAHSLPSAFRFMSFLHRSFFDLFDCLERIISHADLIIGASLAFVTASLAEAMNIPYRYIAFTPQLLPSKYHPVPVFKYQHYPEIINAATWHLTRNIDRFNMTRWFNQVRRKLALPSISDAWSHILGRHVIVASDPLISKVPPDVRKPYTQSGYMHLHQPKAYLPELEDFLNSGLPPVYAGFGSMPQRAQEKNAAMIIKAVRKTGRRMVMAGLNGKIPSGKNSNTDSHYNNDVFFIREYPHSQLFPKVAAVIHHGGAGTTASAAACGVPQIIVPHILDQYYWGHRLHQSGLGPKPIWQQKLTAPKLSRAVSDCLGDTAMTERAKKTGEKIKKHNSLKATADAVTEKNI